MPGKRKTPRAAKVQYWRITRIDELIRSGRRPNSAQLARELEVTQRTVKRDIEYLRLYFGAPVEYDAKNKGYYYSSPGFNLPAVSLTEEEHFWLQLAPLFFEQFKRTPVYERITSIFEKISRACPRNVSINMKQIRGNFSATGEPGTVISREVWDAVFSALTNRKPLVMTYTTPGAESKRRTVGPLHALCNRGEWYLVADTKEGIRTFALSRVSEPRVVAEGKVTTPEGFDIKAYKKNSFGIFRGTKLYKVRIEFSKVLAPYIRERIWHVSQSLKERQDGGVELSFTVNHLFDVKRWLLSWGAGAVARAPKELVREMAKETKALAKEYKNF